MLYWHISSLWCIIEIFPGCGCPPRWHWFMQVSGYTSDKFEDNVIICFGSRTDKMLLQESSIHLMRGAMFSDSRCEKSYT